jgi:hypothetical protein
LVPFTPCKKYGQTNAGNGIPEVVLDIRMPDMDGNETLFYDNPSHSPPQVRKQHHPEPPAASGHIYPPSARRFATACALHRDKTTI